MLSLNKYLKTGKLLIVVCLFLFKNTLLSQTNLIQNSSFEKYSIQIDCNGGFDVAGIPSPYHIVDNWYTYQSPDYFNTICSAGGYNVPYNAFGNSFSKHANAYAGLGVYLTHPTLDLQEYIYQNLDSPLKADTIYCLSFFISYSDRTTIAIKNIGASFSASIEATTPTGYINATPQVVNINGFLTDTINWVEIQGCFTALGGEQYITIGNFNSNSNTDTIHTKTNNPFSSGSAISYYYIDSVTLWKNNFPTFIKEENKNELVSVYPNPTSGKLKLIGQNLKEKERCMIKITDMLGREVKQLKFEDEIDVTELEKGIYFLSVYKNNQLIETKKIIKE